MMHLQYPQYTIADLSCSNPDDVSFIQLIVGVIGVMTAGIGFVIMLSSDAQNVGLVALILGILVILVNSIIYLVRKQRQSQSDENSPLVVSDLNVVVSEV